MQVESKKAAPFLSQGSEKRKESCCDVCSAEVWNLAMTKRELESREDVAKTLLTQQELAIQKFDKIIDDIKDTRRLVDKSRSDAKILHFKTAEMRKKAKQ